jgi:hypothetical protein
MDDELKAKWVAALRSGEYKQGRNCYYNAAAGTHCCLDVLALVYHGGPAARGINHFHGAAEEELPPLVADELMRMNDSGTSFAEIADHIEANL